MQKMIWPLVISFALLLLVIFILPFFSVAEYSLVHHSTTQLGAQNSPHAWMMNTILILLGASTILAGWKYLGEFWFLKGLLLALGLSLILSGVYHPAPIESNLSYDLYQDDMHSLFTSITGFSFAFLALAIGFISKARGRKTLAILTATITIVLSLLIVSVNEYVGVWQRLLMIFAFAWMIFEFRTPISVE